MVLLVCLTGGIYIIVVASFFYGWEKLSQKEMANDVPSVFVSIIVPMRDEEFTIIALLNDLTYQDYPSEKYEIIVVDDHSTDRSVEVSNEYAVGNLTVLSLPEGNNGKKTALNFGIKRAIGDLVITTDADCRMGHKWLRSIAAYYQQANPVMILSPVVPTYKAHSFWRMGWEQVLSLELFSLLGSTAGSAAIKHPVMCNGANLAFSRSVYPDIVAVYEKTDLPSGDDIFVMLALKKKYPGKVHFFKSKEAAVFTELPDSLFSFFKQRGRWASKAKFYTDPAIVLTALIVACINLTLASTLIYGILTFNFTNFFILFILKSLVDYLFLYRITSFFGQRRLMFWFPLAQSIYFLYVCIALVVAIFVPIGWKGRKI